MVSLGFPPVYLQKLLASSIFQSQAPLFGKSLLRTAVVRILLYIHVQLYYCTWYFIYCTLYRCKCLVTWFPVYDTAGYNYVTTGTYSMYNNYCTCTGSLYICDLFVHSYLKESTCLGRLIFSRNFGLFNILLYILKKESKNNVEFKIKTNSKSDHIYSLQI